MFKCRFNQINSNWYLLVVFALLFSISSCTNQHKEELKHLSTLQDQLEENKEDLNIDAELFEYRIAYMDSVLRAFKNSYTETMSLELGNNLTRYKSIKKVYKFRLGEYNANIKEQAELENQLTSLEKDVKDGKLSKDEFKEYYNIEKNDVQKLIESSKLMKKALYELEPDYTRMTKELGPILNNMKE